MVIPPDKKKAWDDRIATFIFGLSSYHMNDVLLCYVSNNMEVDTKTIINTALRDGKQVAVPKCLPDSVALEFYFIGSLDELVPGCFGILEPDSRTGTRLKDLSKGLSIVPGLLFDQGGYRLGYGKGYYDRFLAGFKGVKAGLCYQEDLCHKLPRGRYDIPMDMVITEKNLITLCESEGSGF